jgi:hypothetical protein
MVHFHLSKGIIGTHSNSLVLSGGLGYTHKCIIETIGWFNILIDYCDIAVPKFGTALYSACEFVRLLVCSHQYVSLIA